jgi:hypothetical protein
MKLTYSPTETHLVFFDRKIILKTYATFYKKL